jgi:hypothetical protein
MSLGELRETVIKSDLSDWYTVDHRRKRAILESDISIAIQWERDVNALRGSPDAYSCYTGLTKDLHVGRVLVHGQPIFEETLLTVKFPSRSTYGGILFVPLAYHSRRRWHTDALSFALARLVNRFCWREGYESYMEGAGVCPM